MLAALALLTIAEILIIGAFALALVASVVFDRRGNEAPKWFALMLAITFYASWTWGTWTFASVLAMVLTTAFWAPVGMYLAVGLAYAVIFEFTLDVRRSVRLTAPEWARYIQKNEYIGPGNEGRKMTISEAIAMSKTGADGLDAVILKFAKSRVDHFATYFTQSRIVKMDVLPDGLTIQPRVDTVELGKHLSAWTIFWPAYAVSWIIGDLLAEVFQTIANFVASLAGRVVRASFSNVFKL